ncbi:hypothetical protein, partial [Salmonella enterica]|uniref:hypothetical protein n=1 Tax=Salmonella enterica TaxID=28901 RepID=UPI003D2CF159
MPLIAYMIGLHAPLIFSFVLLAALSSHGSSSLAIGASAALLGLGSLLFTYLAKLNIQKCRKMAD